MTAMYLLLLGFRIRPIVAVLGAWAFAFNTFNFLSLEAGHNAKIWSVCLVPLILYGVHLAFHSKKLLGAAVTALAVLLQLKFNHLQITYYTLILVVGYGIGQLVVFYKEKRILEFTTITALLLAGAILGAVGNLARLSSVLEYSPYSTRGESNLPETGENQTGLDRDYAFSWSNGIVETFTLVIPNYYGGASQQALPEDSAWSKPCDRRELIQHKPISLFRMPPRIGGTSLLPAALSMAGPLWYSCLYLESYLHLHFTETYFSPLPC